MTIVCLSACVPIPTTFEQLVDFYEIQNVGHATEDEVGVLYFTFVASTICKWRAFIFLQWMQNLHQ
jgi:hypothetical protein